MTIVDDNGDIDAKCDEVLQVWQKMLIETVAHDCSRFEHDSKLDQ